jgi:uncharacterized membrane protein
MEIPWLDGVLQWLHVLAAVLAVGGVFFLRFVLCPALKKLPPEQDAAKTQLLQSVVRNFKMVIHSSIAVLLLTGFYRYLSQMSLTKGWSQYHMFMGIKILLAFVVFFLAIMLTLPGEKPNYFQRNRDRSLLISFVLGAIVILLSATLRRMWDAPH